MAGGRTFGPPIRPTLPTLRDLLGSPAATLQNLILAVVAIGSGIFLLGYAIAWGEGFGGAYLASFSMQVVLLGVIAGPTVVLWGARYHLQVWGQVQPCFAVDDQTYADTVDPVLEQTYSGTRIARECLAGFGLVVGWDVVLGNRIPYAIWVAGYESADHLLVGGALGIDALSVINYLYGAVALVTVVAGIHGVVYFLRLTQRVTDLPLQEVEVAADRLEPIARFSIFVATCAFVAVVLLLVVYGRLVTTAGGDAASLASFVAEYDFFILVVITGLILVGVAVFWVPQIAIHDAIMAAKHDRLAAIEAEYDRLLEQCRATDGSPDGIGTEFDIVEAQRRNAVDIDTWSYNLPSLLTFLGSGLATTVTWLLSITDQLSGVLG